MSNVRMKLRQECHINALYTFNFGCVPLGHAFHVIKNIYKKIFIEFVNRKIKQLCRQFQSDLKIKTNNIFPCRCAMKFRDIFRLKLSNVHSFFQTQQWTYQSQMCELSSNLTKITP